ncbi:MAG: glycosyltransferase family 4 protein [Vulcanimicrobiaceae bacterium]
MKRTNVLVLVSPQGEAMARDVQQLCIGLGEDYQIEVLAAKAWQPLFAPLGLRLHVWEPLGILRMALALRNLREAVERFRPDVVHVHGFAAAAAALGTFPQEYASRTITSFHDPLREHEVPRKMLELRFPQYAQRAARLTAAYPALARSLEKRFALDEDSVAVIPHSVAAPPLDSREVGRPPGRAGPVLGWIGKLAGVERAWRTAIEALAIVRRDAPDARLEIAGSGPARQFVSAHARFEKVPEVVKLCGDVAPAAMFAGIDLLLVPASRNAEPQPLLEALVWGVPVIAANAGALADTLREFETGWLVPNDPQGFADGIQAAWSDIDAAWSGAMSQREAARQRYDREVVVARYCELYDRIVGTPAEALV